MNGCLIIPHYNHIEPLKILLPQLAFFEYPCIIVDDGSEIHIKNQLRSIAQSYPWVEILHLNHNTGKGAAMCCGFKHALQRGYTHALQIDADGQHCISDIPKFIDAASLYPQHLISAKPVFDASIPKVRFYGRKITNFWVMIETWSTTIADAMCGFRVYPLQTTLKIIEKVSVSKRMAFDIDILVRHYWDKTPLLFIPSPVTYPDKGVSHFKLVKDNMLISLMHCRLCCEMFFQIPQLLKRVLNHE